MSEESKTKPQQKDEPPERGRQQRRPRGIGGVLLIMALLLALFVMISNSGMETEGSVYDFYRHLLNGRIQTAQFTEDRVHATIRPLGAEDRGSIERLVVILD